MSWPEAPVQLLSAKLAEKINMVHFNNMLHYSLEGRKPLSLNCLVGKLLPDPVKNLLKGRFTTSDKDGILIPKVALPHMGIIWQATCLVKAIQSGD